VCIISMRFYDNYYCTHFMVIIFSLTKSLILKIMVVITKQIAVDFLFSLKLS